jgi:hypothetical protein
MKAPSSKFTTVDAARRLLSSMEQAINGLIDEIRKPVDPELTGSPRKAELSAIKQSVIDARELIQERQRLEELIRSLEDNDEVSEERDFKAGFAERKIKG